MANSRTGDLAAAIETSDRAQRQLAVTALLLLGAAIALMAAVRAVQHARRGERAEWACWVEVLEGERDDARDRVKDARFEVDAGGEVKDNERGTDA